MLTVLLCAFLCVCAYLVRIKLKSNLHKLPPAYPGALPIIGHTHLLLTDTAKLWHLAQETAKEAIRQGGVIHAVLGTQIYYLIADPEDALKISNACLEKHFGYEFVKPWLGDGILIAPVSTWRHHRKMLNPAFSLPVIYGHLDVFNSQARKLTRVMEAHDGQKPFIPNGDIRKVALETFCLVTYGNEIEDKHLAENYMTSLDVILSIATERFQSFWLHSDILFKFSRLWKEEQKAIENLKKMSDKIIVSKKSAMKNCDLNGSSGMKHETVLELLLEESNNGTVTNKIVREQLDGIIAPAFETISNQLVYTLMFLGANPNVQNKMYEEILEIIGPDRDVSKEDINRLVYTNAVIMESLRVLPSVPLILRYVDKDVKLKNYTLRAGSQCVLYPLMNQDDPVWGPSGDKFIPERWLEDPKLCAKKEFAGFGLGKRSCVGKLYAMVAMKIFLAHFIRRFKVTADMSNLKHKIDFVLKPVAGHQISITRRNVSECNEK